MGVISIACYRPKAGQEQVLRGLVETHVPELRAIGLATERTPITMRAADGTIVEVFEWASSEAVDAAHGHPVVHAMWARFGAACDYVPLAQVPEAAGLFASFAPL